MIFCHHSSSINLKCLNHKQFLITISLNIYVFVCVCVFVCIFFITSLSVSALYNFSLEIMHICALTFFNLTCIKS